MAATIDPFAEPEAAETPAVGLGIPLALVASSAALFLCSALEAFGHPERDPRIGVAVLGAAVWGWAAGVWLGRMRRLSDPMFAAQRLVRVGLLVVATGAGIGGTVGLARWGTLLPWSLISGGLLAVLFVPSCLVVVDASHRAQRARFGSVVASFDRRTVHSTLIAVVALAALVQLPAIALAEEGALLSRHQARLGFIVALGCFVTNAFLRQIDLRAKARMAQLVAPAAEGESSYCAGPPESVGLPDLGLGDQYVVSAATQSSYRQSARGAPLLRGNIDEARRAVQTALTARGQALALTAACSTAFLLALLLTETVSLGR